MAPPRSNSRLDNGSKNVAGSGIATLDENGSPRFLRHPKEQPASLDLFRLQVLTADTFFGLTAPNAEG
jgi:hypothetical protein